MIERKIGKRGQETLPHELPFIHAKKIMQNFERLRTVVLMRSNYVLGLERWIDWRRWWIRCRLNHRSISYNWRILGHSMCGCQMIMVMILFADGLLLLLTRLRWKAILGIRSPSFLPYISSGIPELMCFGLLRKLGLKPPKWEESVSPLGSTLYGNCVAILVLNPSILWFCASSYIRLLLFFWLKTHCNLPAFIFYSSAIPFRISIFPAGRSDRCFTILRFSLSTYGNMRCFVHINIILLSFYSLFVPFPTIRIRSQRILNK